MTLPLIGIAAFALAQTPPTVAIEGVAEKGRSIDPGMVGYNSDFYSTTNPWETARRREAAAKAHPGTLRYPGGTSANYWDAYHSRMFHDVETVDAKDGNPAASIRTRYTISWIHNAFFWINVTPLSDYKLLYKALKEKQKHINTIYVANMVTPGPDYYSLKFNRPMNNSTGSDDWWTMLGTRYGAFDYMLKDAKNNGLPITHVELGNEYYFGTGLTHNGKPADVEPYVAGSLDADNNFTYEDVGTFPDKSGDKDVLYLYSVAANDWADKLKKQYPNVQVCAVGSFVDKESADRRPANWNQEALATLDPKKVDAISLHFYGGPKAGSLTDDEEKLGQAVTSWRAFWNAGIKRSKLPDDFDLWITEFNIDDEFGDGDTLPTSKGTWGNGLGNIYCLHHWLAHEPRVKIALMHELARVIVKDGPEIQAHGRAWSLLAQAATGHSRARAIELKNVPMLQGSNIPGIIGWTFDTPNGKDRPRSVIVNFTSQARTLTNLQRLTMMKDCHAVQAYSKLNNGTDPGETSYKIEDGTLQLPGYSITIIKE